MAVQPQQSSIFGLLMSPHHAYDAWPGQAISVAGGGQQFGHAHCQWSSPRFDWLLVMSVCPLTLQFGPRSEANSQRRLHIVSPFFSGLGDMLLGGFWFCFLVIWTKGHEFVMRSPGQQIEVLWVQFIASWAAGMSLMQLRFLASKRAPALLAVPFGRSIGPIVAHSDLTDSIRLWGDYGAFVLPRLIDKVASVKDQLQT